MAIFYWQQHVMFYLATTAQFTCIRVVCNNTLAIALRNGRVPVQAWLKFPQHPI